MKKKFLKATLVVAAIAAVGLGSYKAYGSYIAANMSDEELLTAENIEALAGMENGKNGKKDDKDTDNNKYYLHHFDCKFTISTKGQVGLLAKWFGINANVGATIDLTPFTQYFNNEATDGEGPCEKGSQITCNDLIYQISAAANS